MRILGAIQCVAQAGVCGEWLPHPRGIFRDRVPVYVVLLLLAAFVIGLMVPPWVAAAPEPAALPHAGLPEGDAEHAGLLIDLYLSGLWQGAEIDPAAVVDDSTFLRRTSLALIGMPPTADEVLAFSRDLASDKREAKLNELLKQSRYADYWAFRQRQWIFDLRESVGQGTNFVSLYQYLRESLAENRKWDVVTRDLVATQGAIKKDGRANFGIYFDGESNEYAEAAMRLFLGTNLACAQCHDDPYVDQYKRESYWGLSAFFGRIEMWDGNLVAAERFAERFPDIGRGEQSVSTLPGGDAAIDGGQGENRALADIDSGEVEMPDPKNPQTMFPTPLGGAPIVDADDGIKTRRELFADWIVGPQRHALARAAVNRYFLELTGRGFVERADGFAPNKMVRHADLLDRLADGFVAHQFDIKWLIRTVVLSKAFQLEAADDPAASEMWHTAARRNLNSDQWCNSVLRATGREDAIYGLGEQVRDLLEEEAVQRVEQRRKLLIEGAKALRAGPFPHLADRLPVVPELGAEVALVINERQRDELSKLREQYGAAGRSVGGQRNRARMDMSPTSEALMKMNGPLLAESLSQGTRVSEIEAMESGQTKIEQAFLSVLARLPSSEESSQLLALIKADTGFRVRDLLWSLMQTSEFQSR